MNTVSDLAARAVSFITVIQDEYLSFLKKNKIKLDIAPFDMFLPEEREKLSAHILACYSLNDRREDAPVEPKRVPAPSTFEERAVELVFVSTGHPRFKDAGVYVVQIMVALSDWIHTNAASIGKYLDGQQTLPTPHRWRECISAALYAAPGLRVELARVLEYIPVQIVLAIGGTALSVQEQRLMQIWVAAEERRRIHDAAGLQGRSSKETAESGATATQEGDLTAYRLADCRLINMLGADCETFDDTWEVIVEGPAARTKGWRRKTRVPKTTEERAMFMAREAKTDELIVSLLQHDMKLADELIAHAVPLSFDLISKKELEEIQKNRVKRYNAHRLVDDRDGATPLGPQIDAMRFETGDANGLADEMNLYGLALSGGGIRSATFNLGILQGLARHGLLDKFDYLSTVSGGGYIGSWLAAWIKREGSVAKVRNRLDSHRSPDPFAEEVRPIRWLRMYSNHFAPNAGIMSADAWTIGVTWLRNTLLNQFILLLIFLSVLLGLRAVFRLWSSATIWSSGWGSNGAYVTGAIALLAIGIFAGVSMQVYEREQHAIITNRDKKTFRMNIAILSCAMIGALVVSAGFFTRPPDTPFELATFLDKLKYLWPAAVVIFSALATIAYVGRYDRCIRSSSSRSEAVVHFAILGSSLAATIIAVLCLIGIWILLQDICTNKRMSAPFLTMDGYDSPTVRVWEGIGFMIGIPLVLLVFGITVVARMALLGRYFPDDRREWWGRIGAELARLALLFMLFSGSSLIGLELVEDAMKKSDDWWTGPVTLGSWATLVGGAVKAAFSEKTSGNAAAASGKKPNLALNLLSVAGPYIFVLGLLIFLPALLIPLQKVVRYYVPGLWSWARSLGSGAVLAGLAYLLARRVGVNEFSMHHFYRNRLVRAYLGATRRRTDRDKTANPYTNFDPKDDVRLSELTFEDGYHGPFPILNTALNASQASSLDRQDRMAESFTFSPLYCGFDFSMTRASAEVIAKSYDYGYRPTADFAYPGGPHIGTAMAISGAAVNPNQGYHSSPGIAFLLTVFNVQMGWWMGNPRKRRWQSADPKSGLGYILLNLIGRTSTRDKYVCLSDGGHFDNMGLYELIRRRCKFIILGDAEQDEQFTCEGLANAIRRCRIDFGAEIDIDVSKITKRDGSHRSEKQYAIGDIRFAGESIASGKLIYIKSSVKGDEPVDVQEYALKNPTFPHQTTADQFFDEEQFESYRRLGLHIAGEALSDTDVRTALQIRRLHYFVTIHPGGRKRPQRSVKYRITRRKI